MIKGNHVDAKACDQKNNTITKGYVSSEQLHKMLEKSGISTVSYIEKIKNSLSEEDIKAQTEQIASEEFRQQLYKAVDTAKEKINQIYEKAHLSQRLGDARKEIERQANHIRKQLESEQIKKLEAENKALREAQKPITANNS